MHSIKDIVKQLIGKSLDAYNTKYTKVLNTRIDNIVAQAGNDNTEIVDARIDSAGVTHTTLNNRILAETKMNDEQLVEYTGSNISAEDTIQGYLKDVEILGNTIQNEEDLADIKSVGVLQEDGTYKMSILSCGKNLIEAYTNLGEAMFIASNGNLLENSAWRYTKDYFKVAPNKEIVIGETSSNFRQYQVSFYDVNYKWIQTIDITPNTISTITPQNAHYMRFSYSVSVSDSTVERVGLQVEYGTVATPYEPYQGNKCDILLPCQLEKVGDVSDRLYYDDVEKAWCIEKNVETIILNGSETWLKYPKWDTINTMAFYLDYNAYKVYNKHVAKKEYTECKSNLFNYSPRTDFVNLADKEKIIMYGAHTGVDINITTCSPQISILKSKLPTQDVTGFKTWLSQNPTLVKYQLATPQKIVLPLSTQIQLNSFFGTTHIYMESGEVEGTIKCKIPKSIGATVQSLNNKTDILSDRIEAIEGLKDSQNMKYETDKGYLVCKETKNGVIDDLKIEGKTLVNKFAFSHAELVADSRYNVIAKDYRNITNIKVTIINPSTKPMWVGTYDSSSNAFIKNYKIEGNSSLLLDLTNIYLYNVIGYISDGWVSSDELKQHALWVEGDHTQNPPSYFEGLMSVGQDVDKIEVLSVNENLFDRDTCKYNTFTLGNGEESPNSNYVTSDFIKVNGNTSYYVEGLPVVVAYDSNKNFIKYIRNASISDTFTTDFNCSYVKIRNWNSLGSIELQKEVVNSAYLIKGTTPKPYTPHQSDKKQILFYNENGELEPIQELHEWDSIEKHSDNKWYYHKRSGKVTFDGSGDENWKLSTWSSNNTITFQIRIDGAKGYSWATYYNGVEYCDKFVSYGDSYLYNNDVEGFTVDNIHGDRTFRILKTKLPSQDVAGFKQWLQTNNLTVLYQLAQEEVYEITPLHLDSYANETLILCNSGAISPKMEFSITSHINELIKSQGERINLLEEKVYQYMVTQNRIQLASTYSADSVTFKVDYFSLCGDEENYDEDLYNLILNNILVGKDNYNYDKMFTMILDYASWNQISWEQFDILVELMDIQHNPPVEEEITEDETIEETPVE